MLQNKTLKILLTVNVFVSQWIETYVSMGTFRVQHFHKCFGKMSFNSAYIPCISAIEKGFDTWVRKSLSNASSFTVFFKWLKTKPNFEPLGFFSLQIALQIFLKIVHRRYFGEYRKTEENMSQNMFLNRLTIYNFPSVCWNLCHIGKHFQILLQKFAPSEHKGQLWVP
jgi:hypothetical protein